MLRVERGGKRERGAEERERERESESERKRDLGRVQEGGDDDVSIVKVLLCNLGGRQRRKRSAAAPGRLPDARCERERSGQQKGSERE